jgi:hypothetical protein
MARLPQEITDMIIGFLFDPQPQTLPQNQPGNQDEDGGPDYDPYGPGPVPIVLGGIGAGRMSRYATINREFQRSIELRTFHSLKFNTSDLNTFKSAMDLRRHGHRWFYVKDISFEVVLRPFSQHDRHHMETDVEQKLNNDLFYENIAFLFNVLSQCPMEKDVDPGFGITFELTAASPSDGELHLPTRLLSHAAWARRYPYIAGNAEHRWKRSFLTIESLAYIKDVPCVINFRAPGRDMFHERNEKGRGFEPASIVKLASKMPRLSRVDWYGDDNEKWKPFLKARQDRRYGMYASSSMRLC